MPNRDILNQLPSTAHSKAFSGYKRRKKEEEKKKLVLQYTTITTTTMLRETSLKPEGPREAFHWEPAAI